MKPTLNLSLGPNGTFSVALPGHKLSVPQNDRGIAVLVRILSAQGRAEPIGSPIGTDGNPIQYMVDQWLKGEEQKKKAARVAAIAGLDLDLD